MDKCDEPGTCPECSAELKINSIKVEEVELFCPNEDCPRFCRAFWVDRW